MNFEIFFWFFSKNSSDRGGESSGSLFFLKREKGRGQKSADRDLRNGARKAGYFPVYEKRDFERKLGEKSFW